MSGPRSVSVVMPTRGGRPLLRSIQSALEQKGVAVEVVVVMNGTGDVGEIPPDDRVRVIRSDPALAGNGARSLGIRESRFDLVALLDDDDFWERDKLSKQLDAVSAEVLASANWVVSCAVTEHLASGDTKVVPTEDPGEVADMAEYLAIRRRLRSIGQQFQSSTLLFPRSLGVGLPFDPAVRVHQDWAWVVEAQRQGATMLCVYEPLSHRVLGSPNAITRSIPWRTSLDWSKRYLSTSSRRARGDFPLTISADRAMAGRDLGGWLACGWAAVRSGTPGLPAWIFYLSLPIRARRLAQVTDVSPRNVMPASGSTDQSRGEITR